MKKRMNRIRVGLCLNPLTKELPPLVLEPHSSVDKATYKSPLHPFSPFPSQDGNGLKLLLLLLLPPPPPPPKTTPRKAAAASND